MTLKFEDQLLTDLREVVRGRPAPASPALRGRSHARPLLATSGGAALAIAGAIAIATAGTASPAYAVQAHKDGVVTVQIRSLNDPAGLQKKLRAVGVPALVENQSSATTAASEHKIPVQQNSKEVTFSLNTSSIRHGQRVEITSDDGHLDTVSVSEQQAMAQLPQSLPAQSTATLISPGQ